MLITPRNVEEIFGSKWIPDNTELNVVFGQKTPLTLTRLQHWSAVSEYELERRIRSVKPWLLPEERARVLEEIRNTEGFTVSPPIPTVDEGIIYRISVLDCRSYPNLLRIAGEIIHPEIHRGEFVEVSSDRDAILSPLGDEVLRTNLNEKIQRRNSMVRRSTLRDLSRDELLYSGTTQQLYDLKQKSLLPTPFQMAPSYRDVDLQYDKLLGKYINDGDDRLQGRVVRARESGCRPDPRSPAYSRLQSRIKMARKQPRSLPGDLLQDRFEQKKNESQYGGKRKKTKNKKRKKNKNKLHRKRNRTK